jgi:hypothetical protein
MPVNLLHFLATLATDSELMEEYLQDPDDTMRKFKLSDRDRQLVLSKDVLKIELTAKGTSTHISFAISATEVPSADLGGFPVYIAPTVAGTGGSVADHIPPPPPMHGTTHFTTPIIVHVVPPYEPATRSVDPYTKTPKPKVKPEPRRKAPKRPKTPPTH